jgi:hypothetical protein
VIGIGLWVRVQGHESLWSKVKRALKMEKEESLDLINALVRPAGAHTILDVMQRIAMIDKNLDERELAYMQAFADRWNIKIDFLKAVESATEETTDQMHINLR